MIDDFPSNERAHSACTASSRRHSRRADESRPMPVADRTLRTRRGLCRPPVAFVAMSWMMSVGLRLANFRFFVC
jgi:hypothetical protein